MRPVPCMHIWYFSFIYTCMSGTDEKVQYVMIIVEKMYYS